jgi:hypothetical protein
VTTAPPNIEREYVAARTVLLDALDALLPHRPALVVVGAQAVYARTGSAGLTLAPYTTDGDVALDPQLLRDDPLLEEAMRAAHFELKTNVGGGIEPGTWIATTSVDGVQFEVPVDLIVPEAVLAGGNTRGARLPVHGKRAAKRTHGLEAALVDYDVLTLGGLAIGDDRRIDVHVASAAALLIAKAHKLSDRVQGGRAHRLDDKDAADVLRLIRATPLTDMAQAFERLRIHPVAGPVTAEAAAALGQLFASPGAPGVGMAVRAVRLDLPAAQVAAQLVGYVGELLGQFLTKPQ